MENEGRFILINQANQLVHVSKYICVNAECSLFIQQSILEARSEIFRLATIRWQTKRYQSNNHSGYVFEKLP